MDEIIVRALLAGLGVAAVAGPLGCFLVWRKMAFFGAAVSHSALLGVALGLLTGIDEKWAVVIVVFIVALLLAALQTQQQLAIDTLLSIIGHSALALGLIAVTFLENVRVDLMGYLFGDILAVNRLDLLWIYAGGAVILLVLWRLWRPLLTVTINAELASVAGYRVALVNLVFMLLIGLSVAISMQIVGLLLIVSLLILPAAAARRTASTPLAMAAGSVIAGAVAVTIGLLLSVYFDRPAGPSVIVAAAFLFALSRLYW